MTRLLLMMLLVPSLALAVEEKTGAASDDPMAKWVPPKVTKAEKDKQEIQALLRSMEAASRTGDLDTAAALVDFPVTMMTDDSKGEAMGEAWSREQWMKVMKPFYDKPMKDVKVTHKPNIFLLSDSLASVDDVATMTKGGKTITARNSMFTIRRDGKWRVKAMAEGGWGDMMAEAPQGTASSTPSSTEGSASEKAGSAAPEPQGTASPPEEPRSKATGSDVQAPERTTK
jgi:uncharacterized protein (TIGR02246 family)